MPAAFRAISGEYCRDKQRCAGPGARVSFWRDASGVARRMVWTGDLSTCSHVGTWVVDEQGKVLLMRSDRPVSREQAAALKDEWDALFAGLSEASSARCGEILK